ncbi:hypothetical protein [Nostoc sp. DSM 114159]
MTNDPSGDARRLASAALTPVAHGGNHARCSTWGNPKTALAPQDRTAHQ